MLSRLAFAALILGYGCTEPRAPEPEASESPAAAEAAGSVEASCPPLRVTVDGVVTELSHGFAVTTPNGIAVHRFDHANVTCENIIAGFWPNPSGSTNTTVQIYDGEGYVAAGSRTQTGVMVTPMGNVMPGLLNVGDTVALCVNEVIEFPRAVGKPPMTIVGRVEGSYCGARPL